MIQTVLASLSKDAWQQAQSTLAREACLSLAASFLLGSVTQAWGACLAHFVSSCSRGQGDTERPQASSPPRSWAKAKPFLGKVHPCLLGNTSNEGAEEVLGEQAPEGTAICLSTPHFLRNGVGGQRALAAEPRDLPAGAGLVSQEGV